MSSILSSFVASLLANSTQVELPGGQVAPTSVVRDAIGQAIRRYEAYGPNPVLGTRGISMVPMFSSGKLRALCLGGGLLVLSVYLTGKYVMYQNKINPIGNRLVSAYIMRLIKMTKQPLISARATRMRFVSTPTVKTKPQADHTHPVAAALRNAAVNQIDVTCMSMGLVPYYIQKSTNDVKHKRRGCRTFYWSKDLAVEHETFKPHENEVIAMIDVDYYIDMPLMLAHYPRTYMISTFTPSAVSACGGEYSFTFNKDNVVKYSVSGGATYEHQVWNYGSDMLLAVSPTFMSMGYQVTSYNVDRKQLDPHHQLILLSPAKTFWSPVLDLSSYLGGHRLSRLVVSDGKFLRLNVQTKDGLSVSTGNIGSYAEATIPMVMDDSIASVARLGKNDITIAQVKTTLGSSDMASASVLTEYHRSQQPTPTATAYPVDKAMVRYQFDPANYDPDAKPAMTPFMSPLIEPAYVPDKCEANDRQAIQGRVTELHSTCSVTPFLTNMITEFIQLMVPKELVRTGHPVSLEEVRQRQSRPTQQALLDKADMSVDESDGTPVQSFMKAEPYDAIKDPRVISTINPVLKQNYSSFVYAFSDTIMKPQPWYAFGKTPKEIAERVAHVCSRASQVIKTDLSRFDGRVSRVLRLLEDSLMQRFFAEEYHEQLCELMLGHRDQRAFSRFCIEYFTLLTRLSGGADTADFNSLDNAFMAYVTIRMTKRKGDYPSPEQAFLELGVYGGDDGLTADVDVKNYTDVCATMGQVLEAEAVMRHDPGVVFLSRQFSPFVWEGAEDSCCDVPRALKRLPLTTSLPPNITPLQKLLEKVRSLQLTDGQTPIIGDLCNAVIRGSGLNITNTGMTDSWWARFAPSVQWPNEDSGWMYDHVEKTMPYFDHGVFNYYLKSVERDASKALTFPLCVSHIGVDHKPHKLDVVADGDVVAAIKVADNVSPTVPPDCTCTDLNCKKNHAVKPSSVKPSLPPKGPGIVRMLSTMTLGKSTGKQKTCLQFAQSGTCKFRKCKFLHVRTGKDEQAL